MIKRISIISTAVLAALLVAGFAWATPDDSSSSTDSTTSTTSTTLAASTVAGSQAATGSETHEAGAAGLVTVEQSGATLSISDVAINSDWVSETEVAAGREVEVKFVNGNQRIDFQAEIEDGTVKTRVRSRTLDGSTDDGFGKSSDDSSNSDDSWDDNSDDASDDSSNSDDSWDDNSDDTSDDSSNSDDDSDDDHSGKSGSDDESSGHPDDSSLDD